MPCSLGFNAEEDEADVMQEAAVSIRKVLAEVPGMTLAIENMVSSVRLRL